MPRDISGNYTLPAGNPVVDDTLIESTWANPTMDDIAVQLNNVITRDGLLASTVPLRAPNGSVGAPAFSFTADTNTGVYREAANALGIAVGGALAFLVDEAGRLSGRFLHNNASGIAGTTNQYIGSGSYTPVRTIVLNLDSVTPSLSYYVRVGNIVVVLSGGVLNPTAANTATEFRLTLPIATTLNGSTANLFGVFAVNASPIVTPSIAGEIIAAFPSNEAYVQFYNNANTGAATYTAIFGYLVA